MDKGSIIFSEHAIIRMFERKITRENVFEALTVAEIIEVYTNSVLCLGWSQERPIHLVIAPDLCSPQRKIITVYEPDPLLWTQDWKRRQP